MSEPRTLKVMLIRHTLSPEETVALGAKLCYSKATIEDLSEKISSRDQSAFIEKLMSMGHESIFEHASFTFGIEGVSRVLLAQLTRHRLASYSVQSQRYVSYEKGFGYIIPDSIKALGEDAVRDFMNQMETIESWYVDWQKRLGGARIMVTMNVRELFHFFSLRMCSRAQWEIRQMAEQMFLLCLQTAPALFRHAGPACLRGKCPEGEKSCGKGPELRLAREKLLKTLEE